MSRLVHDFPTMVRACQMSASDFFCFVEGAEVDSYLYDRIASTPFGKASLSYEFMKSNALTENKSSGGKSPLLQFFAHLRKEKLLNADFKGKKTSFVFFLDKDIDDIEACKFRSRHLIYTEFYDLQNYLFLYGDFIKAAAVASSLPLTQIARSIGCPRTWLVDCVSKWKDWVIFCAVLKKQKISLGGYGRISEVNNPCFGNPCAVKLGNFRDIALRQSGLAPAQFDYHFNEMSVIVNSIYTDGQPDKMFKGKWYLNWLAEHLRVFHTASVSHKELTSALTATLAFEQKWTKYFKYRLQTLVKLH